MAFLGATTWGRPAERASEGGGALSRATVTRARKKVHEFPASFEAIRSGIGLVHWKRVAGSK
jgi:hypothetical protein